MPMKHRPGDREGFAKWLLKVVYKNDYIHSSTYTVAILRGEYAASSKIQSTKHSIGTSFFLSFLNACLHRLLHNGARCCQGVALLLAS